MTISVIKKIIAITGLFIVCIGTSAQETYIRRDADRLYYDGKTLYEQGHYGAARLSMERYMQSADPNSALYMEAAYYSVCCAYAEQDNDAMDKLVAFVEKYPYAPMYSRCYYMLGRLYFEKGNYKKAMSYYEQITADALNGEEASDYTYTNGYALMKQKKYEEAECQFAILQDGNSATATDSRYYHAYCAYCLHNYDIALQEFRQLENTDYAEMVAYHQLQIYDQKGNDAEAVRIGKELVRRYPQSKNNSEAYRILGEASFREGHYADAAQYLQKYENGVKKVVRSDMYMLGMSYYKLGKYSDAVTYLSKVTTTRDSLTQNAYLHIGHCYLKQHNAARARMAYQSAASSNFDTKTCEEALYNYALATYQSNAAFGESTNAFNRFLTEYPNSKHSDEIYNLMASAYLSENNYAAAYESLKKVQTDNPKMREVKEYILFRMGVNNYEKKDYEQAKTFFDQSLRFYSPTSTSAQAYLWRGETNYKLTAFGACRNDLEKYLAAPQHKPKEAIQQAYYTMAYTYFEAKSYTQSLPWFKKYLANNPEKDGIYIDVLSRVGDCNFYARNFEEAQRNYTQAVKDAPQQADYAAYQNAFILGLQKKYRAKITAMKQFVTSFPHSLYCDNARYEIGRAHVILNEYPQAIGAYNELIEKHPKNELSRKSALEIGMLHANLGRNTDAINAYKNVVTKYPGSEEAMVAMESLEALYVERNEVDQYVVFRNTVSKKVITSMPQSSEDSLTYIAAERMYAKGNYTAAAEAFSKYVAKYCSEMSLTCLTAQYYAAESYYKTKKYTEALTAYDQLTQYEGNQYIETALKRAAQISYDQKNYAKAVGYFDQLRAVTNNPELQQNAQLGMLRCNYQQKKYAETVDIASVMLYNNAISADNAREAHYCRAKSFIALNDKTKAQPDLRALAAEPQYEMGAEAKFLLSDYLYKKRQFTEAEAEIMDFIDKGTTYQYWLARCFVLLADIYIAQNDDFQAKQYLLSLQQNYRANDDIQNLIDMRLRVINKRETAAVE